MKIAFIASATPLAQEALENLAGLYGNCAPEKAEVVVALGGDGLVMKTLHNVQRLGKKVFPLRRTSSVGFLCNDYREEGLIERLERAIDVPLHPLRVTSVSSHGEERTAYAINEVVFMRDSPQAARLRISIDGVERIGRFSGDGLLVSTPAGSTAYNHSAGGPIMPLDANTLVMTAISGFRPRHWSYAVLPQNAVIEIDVLEIEKRPVRIEAELDILSDILKATIVWDPSVAFTLLFDPEQHLSERIVQEQFMI